MAGAHPPGGAGGSTACGAGGRDGLGTGTWEGERRRGGVDVTCAWLTWRDIHLSSRRTMTSLTIGLLSAACIYGGALVGFGLQRVLPAHHLGKETQDMIKLAVGVIATSTALVLGLLVSSSKGQFDAMGERLVQFGANMLILDSTLAEYGPEGKPAREQLRRSVEATLRRLWPEERTGGSTLTTME